MKKILPSIGWLLLWLTGPLVFLLAARGGGLAGFPLDDAWIHQTYARSLASGQGWVYAGGPPSAGSTSPLWTMISNPRLLVGNSILPLEQRGGGAAAACQRRFDHALDPESGPESLPFRAIFLPGGMASHLGGVIRNGDNPLLRVDGFGFLPVVSLCGDPSGQTLQRRQVLWHLG